MAYFEGVLGTSLELQVVAESKSGGQGAEAVALAEIDRLEAIFNAYRPDSELRRWQETHNEEVSVSPELAGLLLAGEQWRTRTAGAFNPAVEAFTRLWADHAKRNTPVTASEIAPLLAALEGPLWEVDPTRGLACRLTTLPVTLNSIAKGFIIDAACEIAFACPDVHEVLLNIGGDLRHSGSKPVPVAIADPRSDAENAEPADRIQLFNGGIATSGNYRRGFQIGERWYSHVLDPRSGRPVEDLIGVSVLAPDATTADVLATAFSVLKPVHSLELADSLGNIGVLLIAADGTRHSNAFWEQSR
ncbi:FAD:protein FMN transferase [Abditibacteriota bacterium]|nr:FAD:protein FMN transferase [Abditibacteriota bacterium]